MARCLNCIHCDVCDTDRCEKERLYGQCSDFLHDDDVVPKSEVEKIFEEIENTLNNKVSELIKDKNPDWWLVLYIINKLKKKYTEGK